MFILFVEYYSAFRQAASYMLNHEADLEVVSQAGQVAEGRQKMAEVGIDTAIVNISVCSTRALRNWFGSCTRPTLPYRSW